MRWLDWVVVIAYLVWIVTSGLRASRRTNEVDGYFRANRSLPHKITVLNVGRFAASGVGQRPETPQRFGAGGVPKRLNFIGRVVGRFCAKSRSVMQEKRG